MKWQEVQGLGCDTWRDSELDLAKAYYRRSNILVSNSWEMNCQCNSFLSWNELNESYEYMKIDELENSWKAILELKIMFGFRFSNPKPKTKQILEHLCSLFFYRLSKKDNRGVKANQRSKKLAADLLNPKKGSTESCLRTSSHSCMPGWAKTRFNRSTTYDLQVGLRSI